MRLLIVDDSNLIRSRILRLAGTSPALKQFQVVGLAKDGFDALAQARRVKPDVVTMDLTMPRMDGIACISQLADEFPAVLILVISALADKATALRALKEGAHGFVLKPFTDDQLINALTELVNE
jgi:two-component system, chemotaxis family, chemotaxis protein CheY